MNQSPLSGTGPVAPVKIPMAADTVADAAQAIATDPPAPHQVERAVMLRLQSHRSLRFTRLNVHQCGHDAICLEGFLESNDEDLDLCEVVRGIHGIKQVVNRVLSAPSPDSVPKKG